MYEEFKFPKGQLLIECVHYRALFYRAKYTILVNTKTFKLNYTKCTKCFWVSRTTLPRNEANCEY